MKLSSLEILYLRWTSQGKSMLQVAAIEGTDVMDVKFHLSQAMRALGSRSIAEAIEAAKSRGII